MMRLASRAFLSGRGSLARQLHVLTAWQPQLAVAAAPTLRSPAISFLARSSSSSRTAQWRQLATQATPVRTAAAKDADLTGDLRDDEGLGDDDDEEEWEEFEEDVGPEVSTANLDWGEAALGVARQLLSEREEFVDIELFSLRAIATGKRLDIRLDKMTDLYGSPSLDDIEAFSRAFNTELEAKLGEAAGDIEIEVSSPGAERAVRIPLELERFAELPMKVEFTKADDPEKVETRILQLAEVQLEAAAEEGEGAAEASQPSSSSGGSGGGVTWWRLANVRANRAAAGKGRGLTKKQREAVFEIPVSSLRRVNLHLDI